MRSFLVMVILPLLLVKKPVELLAWGWRIMGVKKISLILGEIVRPEALRAAGVSAVAETEIRIWEPIRPVA